MHDDVSLVARTAREAATLMNAIADHADSIGAMIASLRGALASGATIFTCGNGGSAAEALHFSEELIGRYKAERAPYRALCLSADPTAITCIANDYGFDDVFARQVRGLARPGDALVALSTSGNSPNIHRALEAARELGVMTVGLLGKGGGACRALCDHAIVIPSDETERVQEGHLLVIHQILEALETEAGH